MFTKKIVAAALVSSLAGFTLAAQAAGDNGASIVLQGVITNTTCALDVNGVNGGTTVDTKDHPVETFADNANNLTGSLFPMKITLKGCLPDSAEAEATVAGNLIVLGNVAANGNNNIFVGNSTDTGFMVLKENGTTSADAVQNNTGVPVTVSKANTDYTFQVAMASTVPVPAVGAYTAPITVSFAAE